MNSIERNYSSILNKIDTQIAMNEIRNYLDNLISNKFNIIPVRSPKFSVERISIAANKEGGGRQINFDSTNDNEIYYIYDDYRYWLVNTIHKLEIKHNNAILMYANYIDRDSEIKNTQSIEKNKLYIEYRFDSNDREEIFQKAKDLNNQIYSIILNTQKFIWKKYDELKNGISIPNVPVERIFQKITSNKNKEISLADTASKDGVFVSIDKKKKLNSQDIFKTFEIGMYTFSKEIGEAYLIYKVFDRRTMSDIEPMTSESEFVMEEYNFGKNILEGEEIRTISIEINLDSLYLFLLQKSHILEIQSGKSISELEKIFIDSNIDHL